MATKLTRAERTQEFIKNITPIVMDAASEYWLLNTLKLHNMCPFYQTSYVMLQIKRNSMLTMDILIKYMHLFDTLNGIEENTNLTVKFIRENLTLHNWDWFLISKNKNMTPQIIEQNNDLPWCYRGLSSNPNLTPEFIIRHINEDWSWLEIMNNKCITFDMIINNPGLPWMYDKIAFKTPPIEYIINNPNIQVDWVAMSNYQPIKVIHDNPDLPWDYNSVSFRTDLPIDLIINKMSVDGMVGYRISKNAKYLDIINHPEIQWDWNGLVYNKNLTEEFIIDNFNKFNIVLLSAYGVITPNILRKYKDKFDKHKCWHVITINSCITQHDIESNPDLPWNNPWLNPNVSESFILKYINQDSNLYLYNYYNRSQLSMNTIFKYNLHALISNVIENNNTQRRAQAQFLQKFYVESFKPYLAAYKIQQWWFKVTTDYKYAACRKKVARDYDDMLAI